MLKKLACLTSLMAFAAILQMSAVNAETSFRCPAHNDFKKLGKIYEATKDGITYQASPEPEGEAIKIIVYKIKNTEYYMNCEYTNVLAMTFDQSAFLNHGACEVKDAEVTTVLGIAKYYDCTTEGSCKVVCDDFLNLHGD